MAPFFFCWANYHATRRPALVRHRRLGAGRGRKVGRQASRQAGRQAGRQGGREGPDDYRPSGEFTGQLSRCLGQAAHGQATLIKQIPLSVPVSPSVDGEGFPLQTFLFVVLLCCIDLCALQTRSSNTANTKSHQRQTLFGTERQACPTVEDVLVFVLVSPAEMCISHSRSPVAHRIIIRDRDALDLLVRGEFRRAGALKTSTGCLRAVARWGARQGKNHAPVA